MSEYTCERCDGRHGPAINYHEFEDYWDNKDEHILCAVCLHYVWGFCNAKYDHYGHTRPIPGVERGWSSGRYLVVVCGIRIGDEVVYVDQFPPEERDRLIREFWNMDPTEFRWN